MYVKDCECECDFLGTMIKAHINIILFVLNIISMCFSTIFHFLPFHIIISIFILIMEKEIQIPFNILY